MDSLQDALNAGARVEEFEIVRVLGRGGFGITYLARDTQLDREVVLKEYMPEGFASRNNDGFVEAPTDTKAETFRWGLDRFSKEAQILAKFKHPAIVSVQRLLAQQSGTAFIVMDYLEGGNLEEKVQKNGTYDFDGFKEIFASLMDGCRAVHQIGILHRDIKPLNIMMVNDAPVVIDFGAARQLERQQKGAVSRIFADGYSPLEQYASDQPQDPCTDIYALAATAYFAFTGEDPPAAPARVAGDVLVPLKEAASGKAPDRFFEAIEWGMQLKAADRPQTIEEWQSAFPDLENKQVIVNEVTIEGIDRRTALLGAAAVGGIALTGLGGYLMTRPDAKPDVSGVVRSLKIAQSRVFGPIVEDSFSRIIPYEDGAYFVAHSGKEHLGNARMYAQQIDSSLASVGDGFVANGQASLGRDIKVLSDGNILIGGGGKLRADSGGNLNSDVEITKLDASGRKIWTKWYDEGSLTSLLPQDDEIVFTSEEASLGGLDALRFIDSDGKRTQSPIEIGKRGDESVERLIAAQNGDVVALNFRWRKNRQLTSSTLTKMVVSDGEAIDRWSVADEEYLLENQLEQSRPHSVTEAQGDVFAVGRISDSKSSSQGGYRASYIYRVDGASGEVLFRKHAFLPNEGQNNRFATRTIASFASDGDVSMFCGSANYDSKKSQITQIDGAGNVVQSVDLGIESGEFQICDMFFDSEGAFVIGNTTKNGQLSLATIRLAWS